MDNQNKAITKKNRLDKIKVEKAKGLNKDQQTKAAVKQAQKLKSAKTVIQEFDEWE